MPIGPIMMDIADKQLSAEDIELLKHPLVGGIILFSRNYESPKQIAELVYEIRHLRENPILIAVDQEGGRVQRFREELTLLPPLQTYGDLYDKSPDNALELVEKGGWLMAIEILSLGIDFSFAPVLDLNHGISEVIGNRSFHEDPLIVTELARYFIRGMNRAGMQATGKHYPGHGSVAPDSHHEIPVDDRKLEEILNTDVIPFAKLLRHDLSAVMPAHIIFSKLDSVPVGFSKYWLQEALRKNIGFNGVIFSDDLSMHGASCMGNYFERSIKALNAGCDMILICNNRNAVIEVVESLNQYKLQEISHQRLVKMCGYFQFTRKELLSNCYWQEIAEEIKALI